jgi:hypothetical protein
MLHTLTTATICAEVCAGSLVLVLISSHLLLGCCSCWRLPGLKSMLLEKRVEVLSEALEMKDAQLGEVLAAAHLDPATLQQVRPHLSVCAAAAAAACIPVVYLHCCDVVDEM